MPTKTEYRAYIASEAWQQRRKRFLLEYSAFCERCELPRWLAVIAYDQDLNVHHKNYAHVGAELDEDLEPLCRRCHEIETFGRSTLREIKSCPCSTCGAKTFNTIDGSCGFCSAVHPIFGWAGAEQWLAPSGFDDGKSIGEETVEYLPKLMQSWKQFGPGLDDSIPGVRLQNEQK